MNSSSISAKSAILNKPEISRTYAALPWIDLHWFGFGKVSFFSPSLTQYLQKGLKPILLRHFYFYKVNRGNLAESF